MRRSLALMLPALAASLVAFAACTKFEPSADDADAATSSEAGTTDASLGEASPTEAGTVGAAGILVGSDNPAAPTTDDSVGAGSLDAQGFIALSSGTARYMDLYVREWPDGGSALVGVYADVKGAPVALLAQGTVANPAKTQGWARAQLSAEVTILEGTAYWLAYYAPTAGLGVRAKLDDACSPRLQTMKLGVGLSSLPATFVKNADYGSCEPAAYLIP